MNSVPNSDSEQCTESKLSRVYSAPTHGLGCALRHVVAHAGSYRGPLPNHVALVPYRERLCPTVSLPARSCCRAVSLRWSRSGSRRVAALPAVSRTSCVVSWPILCRIAALLHPVSYPVSRYTQQLGCPPATILPFLSRHTPQRPGHSHARCWPRGKADRVAGPPGRVAASYCTPARPCGASCRVPMPASPALCHDTIPCIMT